MESRTAAAVPARSQRKRELVVGFSPEKVKAPFLLRCGAFIIDYMVVLMIPVVSLLLSRVMGYDGARLLNSEWTSVGRVAMVLLALANFILLPVFTGQTIGKILTGLRIVRADGSPATTGSMVFRQTGGYLLTAASFGIGFLISVFSNKGRALHDYIAGTVVIYAEKRRRIR
jgi:uncharacterized RDD family membrane protein YckC